MRIGRLSVIAKQRDITVEELVSETLAVVEHPSGRAVAEKLGVSYTAVQWWMARNGYRIQLCGRLVPAAQVKSETSQN